MTDLHFATVPTTVIRSNNLVLSGFRNEFSRSGATVKTAMLFLKWPTKKISCPPVNSNGNYLILFIRMAWQSHHQFLMNYASSV